MLFLVLRLSTANKYLPQDLVLHGKNCAQVKQNPAVLDSRDNGRIRVSQP